MGKEKTFILLTEMLYLVLFLFAALLAIGGLWLFDKLHILDKPGPDVPKRAPVPTLQGIVVFVSFLLLIGLFFHPAVAFGAESPFFGLVLGGGLLVVISTIDELGRIVDKRFRVHPLVRLGGQIAAALIAYLVSGIGFNELLLPGGILIEFGPLSQIVLTVLWYLIFINAINFFDGIYGLASGMTTIGFLTITLLLSVVVVQFYPEMTTARSELLQGVSGYAMILFVISLIATIIEFKPRGLLRDAGTVFLGFALAYLALLGGAKIGTMIVVLALPLFDAIRVVIDRLHRNKNPFKGDFTHLHYRLMALGRNRNEVRVVIWGFSLFLMVLMILQGGDRFGKVIIFCMMALIFFGVNRYLFWYKGLPHEYEVDGKKE